MKNLMKTFNILDSVKIVSTKQKPNKPAFLAAKYQLHETVAFQIEKFSGNFTILHTVLLVTKHESTRLFRTRARKGAEHNNNYMR